MCWPQPQGGGKRHYPREGGIYSLLFMPILKEEEEMGRHCGRLLTYQAFTCMGKLFFVLEEETTWLQEARLAFGFAT